jgi:competence ComEA-like helix-hairpin-helix protein
MGIVRCHSQAQRTKTLSELQAPKGLPELSKDYRSKYDGSKYGNNWKSQHRKYESEQWAKNSKNPKPLSNKIALALLMELRKSQDVKNHLQYLQPELAKILDRKNPFPANININNIDSASLDELPGIGPSTARRILKFREKLGGFYSASQLIEIPKIDTTLVEVMSARITIDKSKLIPINEKVDFKQLYKHPYIGPSKAKILGPFFTQHPQLTKRIWLDMQGLSMEDKSKIEPYLRFIE